MPPLLRQKGAPADFFRGSRQIFDSENTDRVFHRMVLVIPEKYRPNTDRKYQIGVQLYHRTNSTSILNSICRCREEVAAT